MSITNADAFSEVMNALYNPDVSVANRVKGALNNHGSYKRHLTRDQQKALLGNIKKVAETEPEGLAEVFEDIENRLTEVA